MVLPCQVTLVGKLQGGCLFITKLPPPHTIILFSFGHLELSSVTVTLKLSLQSVVRLEIPES